MNRNETIWKAKSFTVHKVVTFAKKILQQWSDANQPLPQPMVGPNRTEIEKWKPPTTGSFKLNINAAIFENKRKSGLGLVIRDDLGSFVASRVVPVQGIVDPIITETLGVREALSWIKSKFFGVQTIEMDALLVYSALQKDDVDNSYLGILIEECRLIAKELLNLKFNWVRRSANQVAHTLVKAASSLHDIVDWSYFPLSFISNVLLADSMNE
ncbi:unnamed protein product [Fraxinus pennsylvanica]|uniref:RNase H type-1 domain-containing protein n=1 Tax=Fraxinus pennsylvanica TaxID=56036 RepID=A0AAD2DXN1_9LAMI|nr:unnamed protein product [Fraxinus pennsylvanica]